MLEIVYRSKHLLGRRPVIGELLKRFGGSDKGSGVSLEQLEEVALMGQQPLKPLKQDFVPLAM